MARVRYIHFLIGIIVLILTKSTYSKKKLILEVSEFFSLASTYYLLFSFKMQYKIASASMEKKATFVNTHTLGPLCSYLH